MTDGFVIGITALLCSASFALGMAFEGDGWRSDCDALGKHLDGKTVYECKRESP